MKKIFTFVGIVVAGVSTLTAQTLHSQYAPGLTPMETAKFWTLSGSLRGFYDDNYTTLPKPFARSSFGLEVSPSIAINLYPNDATSLSASYVYDMRWYEARTNNAIDQTHQFNAKLDHAFSEKYKTEVNESFVVAQEPTILDPNGLITSPLRTDGSNIRNTGSVDFTADLTANAGLELGYANNFYDYEQDAATVAALVAKGLLPGPGPSRSALLDRIEHLASLNLRWRLAPETLGVLGYQFGIVNYTSGEFVDAPLNSVVSSDRDLYSHTLMVGADHSFNPQLNASVRVGAQYFDYYNRHRINPALDSTQIGPYADARLTYTYMAGSYAQAGIRHSHNPTDVIGFSTDPVMDQESTSFYASITHKLTPNITGSVLGQFQHSTFNGGGPGVNGKADDFYIFGVNLAYHFNPHVLVETGYNLDRLDSDLGRSYTRNRAYIGLRATY